MGKTKFRMFKLGVTVSAFAALVIELGAGRKFG